jgi:hypothetical protein
MKRHSVTAILALCAILLVAAFALADAGKPKAVAAEPIKDMGVVPKGEKVTHDFLIRNDGNAPLEITEVRPACGCTVADFDKKIAPGQSGKVHVVVDTETFSGAIAKGVTAFTNDTETPQIELTIRAEVQPVIAVDPGYARYIIVQGEPKEGKIEQTLWASDGAPMAVTKVDSPYPFLKVDFHESKPDELLPEGKGKQWKIVMRLDRDAPVGALADYVRVTTTHAKQKMVEIPISGFVRPVVAVTPPTADFGSLELKEPFKRTFVVRAFSTEPIKVTSVEGTLKGMDTQLQAVQEGREYQIHVTLKPGMAKGPFSGKLTIHTDSPKKPLLEVEVKGTVV